MVCVGEVASSRAWCVSLEYGVSVEYGVSLEYGVSMESVVVVAPKEQKIKKNTN